MTNPDSSSQASKEPNDRTFGLLIPGDTKSLGSVRRMVSDLARMMGFSKKAMGQIEVAVDEACANAIEHAYKGMTQKPPVHIEVAMVGDSFIVDIIDAGKSFDFHGIPLPKFPDHWCNGNVRGAGLFLISQCVDTVEYEQISGGKNRMRLIKQLKTQTTNPPAGQAVG